MLFINYFWPHTSSTAINLNWIVDSIKALMPAIPLVTEAEETYQRALETVEAASSAVETATAKANAAEESAASATSLAMEARNAATEASAAATVASEAAEAAGNSASSANTGATNAAISAASAAESAQSAASDAMAIAAQYLHWTYKGQIRASSSEITAAVEIPLEGLKDGVLLDVYFPCDVNDGLYYGQGHDCIYLPIARYESQLAFRDYTEYANRITVGSTTTTYYAEIRFSVYNNAVTVTISGSGIPATSSLHSSNIYLYAFAR